MVVLDEGVWSPASLERPLHLAEIPEHSGHNRERLFVTGRRMCSSGACCRAAGIGIAPRSSAAQPFEHVVGQRAAEIGRIAGACRWSSDRVRGPVHPGLSTSVREAAKRCGPRLPPSKPLPCKCARTASMTSSYLDCRRRRKAAATHCAAGNRRWPASRHCRRHRQHFQRIPGQTAARPATNPLAPVFRQRRSRGVGSILTSASAARTAFEIRGGFECVELHPPCRRLGSQWHCKGSSRVGEHAPNAPNGFRLA